MRLSVVIPVYDEEQALPSLLATLRPVLDGLGAPWEAVFVDDGSRDGSRRLLEREAAADPRVKVVGFSRNFGHQAAVTAGLDAASGDAVIVMDADLQDPPELLRQMVLLYLAGYDVVSPQRTGRDGETRFKRATAAGFYRVMRRGVDPRLTPQVSDFRLYSRRAVDALGELREGHRFLRGMVAWLGLKEAVIPFRRAARVAGETKYPLRKMLRFAWTAVTSSSAAPLRLTSVAGLALTAAGAGYLLYVLYATYAARSTVPGWSSLASLQVLFGGVTLSAIGLVGDYLARVYEEAKGRPLYVVAETRNLARTYAPRAVWLPPRVESADEATEPNLACSRVADAPPSRAAVPRVAEAV